MRKNKYSGLLNFRMNWKNIPIELKMAMQNAEMNLNHSVP